MAPRPVVVPDRIGWQGAGLGNELVGWAKALIAAEVLGGVALSPAWGLNPRPYRRLFRASRLDVVRNAAATGAARHHVFDEAAHRATGRYFFDDSVRAHAQAAGWEERPPPVIRTGGMWGGLASLKPGFALVEARLWAARDAARHVAAIERAAPVEALRIGVHLRRGDFLDAPGDGPGPQSPWNSLLPMRWFIDAVHAAVNLVDGPVAVHVFSDGTPEELRVFFEEVPQALPPPARTSAAADLLALSRCDLLVCSRSSFSMWAAALAPAPYLWHGPSLFAVDGELSIWDHGSPPSTGSPGAAGFARGIPFGPSDPLPAGLADHLHTRQALRDPSTDLVFYGRTRGVRSGTGNEGAPRDRTGS